VLLSKECAIHNNNEWLVEERLHSFENIVDDEFWIHILLKVSRDIVEYRVFLLGKALLIEDVLLLDRIRVSVSEILHKCRGVKD